MKNFKNLGKRALALLLTLVMCLSMVNLTVFATATGNAGQIVYKGGDSSTPDNVTVSKTIAASGVENYFDITLTVQTKETMEQQVETIVTDTTKQQDVAVVLVLDLSNTMTEYLGGKQNAGSRYANAEKAADKFIESFADFSKGSTGTRKVGVAGFNTDGKVLTGLSDCKTTSQANAIKTAYHREASNVLGAEGYDKSHSRFTNMEAGLKQGYNMLKNSGCKYKYIIFLTDGFPTTYIRSGYSGYDPYCETGTKGNDGVFYDFVSNKYCWYGTSYSNKAAVRAREQATTIKNAGIQIVSIGVDVGAQTIDGYERPGKDFSIIDRKNATYEIGSSNKASAFQNWLKGSKTTGIGSGIYYASENTNLTAAFTGILEQIKTTVKDEVTTQVTNAIKASWVAEDPITSSTTIKAVKFIGFYGKNSNGSFKPVTTKDALKGTAKEHGENTATENGGTISWKLPESGWEQKGSGNNKTYTYTLKYRVRLGTEVKNFTADTSYKTNGTTTLKYRQETTSDGKTQVGEEKTITFPIPQVEGYLGSFKFQKVAQGNANHKLNGAVFTLSHDPSKCDVCKVNTSVTIDDITAKSNGNGTVSFSGIPSGHTYTLSETQAPEGYTIPGVEPGKDERETWKVTVAYGKVTIDTGSKGTQITNHDPVSTSPSQVTNPRDPKPVTVTVTKNWQNDWNGLFRPSDLTVTLTGDNGKTYTVSGDKWQKSGNVWTANVEVPSYDPDTDQAITYTVTETVPKGYTLVNVQPADITPEGVAQTVSLNNQPDENNNTKVTVQKVWVDPTGTRHDDVTVTLYGNGRKVDQHELVNGTWTFDKLPCVDENGNAIKYTVTENAISGYTVSYSYGDGGVTAAEGNTGTITITNTINQELVNINGTKTWKGPVPTDAVTVTLTGKVGNATVYTATVEMTANNTSFAFNNVPKYDVAAENVTGFVPTYSGQIITYTVSDSADGFTAAEAGVTITGQTGRVDLVNTRTDIDKKVSISATKIWDDENNKYNERTGNEVFVLQKLVGDQYVNVEGVDPVNVSGKTDEVVQPDPEPSPTGSPAPDGADSSEPPTGDGTTGGDTTNDGTTGSDITDGDTTDGDTTGDGTTGDGTTGDGTTGDDTNGGDTNDVDTNGDDTNGGDTNDGGTTGDGTTDGDTTGDGTTGDGTTGDGTTGDGTTGDGTTGDDNVAGETYTYVAAPHLSAAPGTGESDPVYVYVNEVSVRFDNLPKYDQNTGAEIVYRVVERGQDEKVYTTSTVKDENGSYTITNTLNGEETSITVTKVWRDVYSGATEKGQRPAATVTLTGAVSGSVDSSLTQIHTFDGASDEQSYTFENLPVYKDGHKIEWSVEETGVPAGYTSAKAENTIINTIEQKWKEVSVRKAWVGTLAEEYRPAITITLTRTDGDTSETVGSITGSDLVNGKYTWGTGEQKLPVYNLDTGHKWMYSVSETMSGNNAEGRFTTAIGVDVEANIPADSNYEAFLVTNTFDAGTTSLGGVKHWAIPNNAAPTDEQIATVEFTVRSTNHSEGNEIVRETGLTVASDGTYTYQFESLPKYDAATGVELTYKVEETGIPEGFTSTKGTDNTTFLNRSKSLDDKVTLQASKNWVGPEESRPDEIIIVVTGSDGSSHELFLKKAEGWTGSMELPKYDSNNEEIAYTAAEKGAEEGKVTINELVYNVTVDHQDGTLTYAFTNTLADQGEVEIKGQKVWTAPEGSAIPEDFEYPEIKVQLFVDGKASIDEKHTATLSKDNWAFDFGTLPKYALEGNGVVEAKDGHTIQYEVKEVDAEGNDVGKQVVFQQGDTDYTFDVALGKDGSYDVTNTYRDTKLFYYELVTNYVTHKLDGTDVVDGSNIVKVDQTQGTRGQEVTAGGDGDNYPSSAYLTYNGNTYTFDSDNGGNVPKVTLEKAGEVYRLVLWYERTETQPYIPSTPHYYYQLVTNYITHMADGTIRYDGVKVQQVGKTEGSKGDVYTAGDAEGSSFLANNYAEYGGSSYSFIPGYTPNDSKYLGSVHEVTLNNPGKTYTLVMWYERTEIEDEPTPLSTTLTVEKVWEGDGDVQRPASVSVQLYKDGAAEGAPIVLSDANEWSYTWIALDAQSAWTVAEVDVPEGYTSSSSTNEDGTVVTITNTYTPTDVPEEEPPKTDIPDEQPPLTDLPDEPVDVPDEQPPLVDLPDEQPPLAEVPEYIPLIPAEPEVEIPEDPVPMVGIPQTGDFSMAWCVTALLSALGLAVLTLKKREDEEG